MNEITKASDKNVSLLIERAIRSVREDMQNNPYIREAIKVLSVEGYRSAIGAFWNAVVDDLRKKIIFRSVILFNKEINLDKEIKKYEDFQDNVSDDQLIEGAYKIGIIGWEAYKILRHAKESRHIFYGHPNSGEPSLIKVLSVIDDCIKYVLNEEYPTSIIDIEQYVEILKSEDFERNIIAIENALGDIPEIYKKELINRLFTIYIKPDSSSTLISNIEFVSPLLWKVLPKTIKVQVIKRLDQELPKSNASVSGKAFDFVHIVGGSIYLSHYARRCKIEPLVKELKENLDEWEVENLCVRGLKPFSSVIIEECIDDYVLSLTHVFVGYVGGSARFRRTDFYANEAVNHIPTMFQAFNDRMAKAFIKTIQTSTDLKSRIKHPSKIKRLRSLGLIIDEKVSENFEGKEILKLLVDELQEENFFKRIGGTDTNSDF